MEGPPLDEEVEHIYAWWLACNETRTEEQRLKPSEVEAWFRWNFIDPSRLERRLFDAIEDEYLTYRREKFHEREQKRLRETR